MMACRRDLEDVDGKMRESGDVEHDDDQRRTEQRERCECVGAPSSSRHDDNISTVRHTNGPRPSNTSARPQVETDVGCVKRPPRTVASNRAARTAAQPAPTMTRPLAMKAISHASSPLPGWT